MVVQVLGWVRAGAALAHPRNAGGKIQRDRLKRILTRAAGLPEDAARS